MRESFSVIIVALNERAHLARLLDSFAGLDEQPLEVLVVDGGSRDGTRDEVLSRVDSFAARGAQLHLLDETGPVRSPGNARNQGIEAARGELLCILDADSVMRDAAFFTTGRACLAGRLGASVRAQVDAETPVETHLARSFHGFSAVLFRREAFAKARFDPVLGYGEDEHFWTAAGLDIDLVCDATLGIHLPQTWREVAAQSRWYGRTLRPFLRAMKRDFPDRWGATVRKHVVARVPQALFYPLCVPLSFALVPWWTPAPLAAAGVVVLAAYRRHRAQHAASGARFRDTLTELLVRNAAYLHGLVQGLRRADPSRG